MLFAFILSIFILQIEAMKSDIENKQRVCCVLQCLNNHMANKFPLRAKK